MCATQNLSNKLNFKPRFFGESSFNGTVYRIMRKNLNFNTEFRVANSIFMKNETKRIEVIVRWLMKRLSTSCIYFVHIELQ